MAYLMVISSIRPEIGLDFASGFLKGISSRGTLIRLLSVSTDRTVFSGSESRDVRAGPGIEWFYVVCLCRRREVALWCLCSRGSGHTRSQRAQRWWAGRLALSERLQAGEPRALRIQETSEECTRDASTTHKSQHTRSDREQRERRRSWL